MSSASPKRRTERLDGLLKDRVRLGEPSTWKWQRDAHGRKCGYVGLDATGVRQQGPRGARADGRTHGVCRHDLQPAKRARRRSPAAASSAVFGGLLRLGHARRGASSAGRSRRLERHNWNDAEQQIALSDGGAGLEEVLGRFFPRATCILDFWHAKEHLVELAESLWPEDEPQRKAWLDEQCPRLKHEGGAAVLAELEALDVSGRSAAVQDAHRRHTGYFRNNTHRMDYPTYIAGGWQIGSGPVESACGTVVGDRLKGSGMRWSEAGSHATCQLRALYLSEPCQWEAFWKDHPN